MPVFLAWISFQLCSTPQPNGVTKPKPVTTTLWCALCGGGSSNPSFKWAVAEWKSLFLNEIFAQLLLSKIEMFTVTKHDDTDDDDDVTEEKELREEEEHARLWLILLFASAASSALIVLMPASEMAKCVYGSTSHRPTMPYRLSLKKYIQNQTPHTHHKKSFFVTWRYDSFHSSRDHEQRWKHQRVLVLRGWIVCRNAGASVVFFFLF